MYVFCYDGTFEGFLTVVFEAFDRKIIPDKIVSHEYLQTLLFTEKHEIITDSQKADRVWVGLHTKVSEELCKVLAVVFLSELPDMELLLFNFIRKAFNSTVSIENNYGDPCVLEVSKIFRKVSKEADRVRMFVRFQKTLDEIYFASFEPQYNVIPLSVKHFENRFPDQKWIIYDIRRKYGFYYDLEGVSEIRFDQIKMNPSDGSIDQSMVAPNEKLFQQLWKTYFDNMAIKERINPRLHKQLLPKRFWKYLPEKQG